MENPRPEKVAVVEEVRERLSSANASVVTEYRGLTVTQLAELRKNLGAVGDYKIYKNTLVRLAIAGSEYEGLTELLSGPTAIAFVNGEISAAAKTLRDFARTYPALIVKGGMVSGAPLSDQDFSKLADLPSRDVLLARFAGGLAAPLQQLAGLLQALPRNFAYGLSALLEERGGIEPVPEVVPEPAPAPEVVEADADGTETAEAPADGTETAEAPADGTETAEAPADGTETAEAPADVASDVPVEAVAEEEVAAEGGEPEVAEAEETHAEGAEAKGAPAEEPDTEA
jgi:large subunit ribosomal protein L10